MNSKQIACKAGPVLMMLSLLSFCWVNSARADSIVVSNLGAGNAFNTTTGWEIIPGAEFADEFTPAANLSVSAVDVALGNITGVPTSAANGVDFALFTTTAGSPGTLLSSLGEVTSFPDFGPTECTAGTCAIHTLTPASSVSLTSGVSYWLVASAGGAGTDAVWNMSNSAGGVTQFMSGVAGWVPVVAGSSQGAFALVGTASTSTSGSGGTGGAPSGVPEPPMIVLLGVGLSALCALGLRKKQFLNRVARI
jgi:hypothetical protein